MKKDRPGRRGHGPWRKVARTGYQACARCGLINLNNRATRKRMRHCEADDD